MPPIRRIEEPPATSSRTSSPTPARISPPHSLSSSGGTSPTDFLNTPTPFASTLTAVSTPAPTPSPLPVQPKKESKEVLPPPEPEVDYFSGMEPSFVKPTIISQVNAEKSTIATNRFLLDDTEESAGWGEIDDI
eukprot:TRINITY_DN3076_c0_g1_i2.p1 TRINITY_DN3076_c0_g1~~TRINITY_DN3076_c0_g1_i2.p1  ORF type:complete len:134 (-),score=48.68 TRINITY_DN3076_c0_g1_i2:328-729(-)